MRCAAGFTTVSALATRRVGLSSALRPTITLLLTIGSLPLPLRNHCTG